MKTVYVATATHNRLNILKSFVKDIASQIGVICKLLIVDDGSNDGTGEWLETRQDITVIKGDGNLWWGGALHCIYEWLSLNANDDDIIFISNDDVFLENDYVQKGVNLLADRKSVLVSGIGIDVNTKEVIDRPVCFDPSTFVFRKAVDFANCASTRSIFLTVATMKRIGGFYPTLLPHYGSDYEWTIRACRKGCKIEFYDDFTYYFDKETTGYMTRSFRTIFSKKSAYNPIYKLSFIFLITPLYLLPYTFACILFRNIIHSFKG